MAQGEPTDNDGNRAGHEFNLASLGLEHILTEGKGPNHVEEEIIDTAQALYYGFGHHFEKYSAYGEEVLREILDEEHGIDHPGRLYWEAFVTHEMYNEERGLILAALQNFFDLVCQGYDRWFFPLLVETMELEELVQIGQHHTAVFRAASLFEHYFRDHPSLPNRQKSTAWYANQAEKAGLISTVDRKLIHFVITLRNDAGHQTWLKTKFDYGTFSLGSIVALKLSGDLMYQEAGRVDKSVLDHDPARDTDSEQFLEIVEQEFGWVYDAGQKKWWPPEQRPALARWIEWMDA